MVSSPEIDAIVPQRLLSLHPQKIAIVRRNGIGDLLMTLPLMAWIKRHLASKLILVCDSRNLECAEWIESPPWDELLVMPRGNKYIEACKMALKLRRHKLDLIVSAKPTSMKVMNVLLGLSGARLKRAVVEDSGWTRLGINWPIARSQLQAYPHQALQVLHLIAKDPSIELKACDYPKMRKVEGSQKERLEKSLKESGFEKSKDSRSLYINLTNNRPTSRLNLDQVIAVLEALSLRPHLILGGLPGERELAHEWQKLLGEKGYRVMTALSYELPFTLAAIQTSDAILTGDGGLMHLAAACNTPQLALFGQTCVDKWKPLSEKARTLFHPNAVGELSPASIAKELEEIFKQERSLPMQVFTH